MHPNDAVNMGQSSNDVIPTALHVAALEGVQKRLVPALEVLAKALDERAHAFDPVVKIGRTHLQDAVPIRLGQEFSGYAARVARRPQAQSCAASLVELDIGVTALGTGMNTHPDFAQRMAAKLGQATGLEFRPADNPFEAMANRDAAVETSGALKTVAISLSNIANNIRWLASGPRCGIGEVKIPELQPGQLGNVQRGCSSTTRSTPTTSSATGSWPTLTRNPFAFIGPVTRPYVSNHSRRSDPGRTSTNDRSSCVAVSSERLTSYAIESRPGSTMTCVDRST